MAIYRVKAIASLGVVFALTVGGSAMTQKVNPPVPTHAVRGVVKSISTFYLVVATSSGKKAHDITLVLDAATEKDGEITIGSIVSVRYRIEGRTLVATAVAAHAEQAARRTHSGAITARSYFTGDRGDSAGPPITAPFGWKRDP
jgi:hypothetical protein